MGYRVYFDGAPSGSGAASASTVSLADGESFSVTFRGGPDTSSEETESNYLFHSSDGLYGILLRSGASNDRFGYILNGTLTNINTGGASLSYYDGQPHEFELSRSGANFSFKADGVQVFTFGGGVFYTDTLAANDVDSYYTTCELSNIVLGSYTYEIASPDATALTDTSGNGGPDFDLAGFSVVKISEWEWIGDFIHIDKNYFTQTGAVSLIRREGRRKRNVCGYSMDNRINKQAGQETTNFDGVDAYNADQLSTLYPVGSSTGVDCSEEIFTPVAGTAIFEQVQKWESWEG